MASREAQPTDYRGRFKELQALQLEARKDDLIEASTIMITCVYLLVDWGLGAPCASGWLERPEGWSEIRSRNWARSKKTTSTYLERLPSKPRALCNTYSASRRRCILSLPPLSSHCHCLILTVWRSMDRWSSVWGREDSYWARPQGLIIPQRCSRRHNKCSDHYQNIWRSLQAVENLRSSRMLPRYNGPDKVL